MINTNFKSTIGLKQIFKDEQICIDYLEKSRWDGDVISPFDPQSQVYKCKENKYKCKKTGKYFNVKTKTMFDSTKIPLQKWFLAIWLITLNKKGISTAHLAKEIEVTKKTARFINNRICNCFGLDINPL